MPSDDTFLSPGEAKAFSELRREYNVAVKWETDIVNTVLHADRRRANRSLIAAIIVTALLSGIAGYYGGAELQWTRGESTVTNTQAALPQFMIFVIDNKSVKDIPPDEMKGRVKEYGDWARSLAKRNILESASELGNDVAELDGADNRMKSVRKTNLPDDVDGIGGYFIIRARNMDEAMKIATECPHLKYGGKIDIRPIVD